MLANWYRPGASEFDDFSALYVEMAQYHAENTGILLVGDLNIHHKRWLHFSSEDTRVGAEMKVFCDFHGLFQIVRAPTRYDSLLDLVITDMTGAKASVLPRIADHNAVKIELPGVSRQLGWPSWRLWSWGPPGTQCSFMH